MRNASYVYQAWDADGDLLYVGVTDNVIMRLAGHQRGNSEWLQYAVRVTWDEYASRAMAEHIEGRLIGQLQPRFNVAMNAQRHVAARMGHRRKYVDEAWSVLAAAVRQRREALRLTQTAVAGSAGVDVAEVRSIERSEKTAYPAPALAALEGSLDWHPGSIEAVLRGEAPNPLTAEEIAARARAGAHAMFARRDAR